MISKEVGSIVMVVVAFGFGPSRGRLHHPSEGIGRAGAMIGGDSEAEDIVGVGDLLSSLYVCVRWK